MKQLTQATATATEALACRYLQQAGLHLLARNFRCLRGEIDLIMQTESQLVFVEVRYRKKSNFGTPAETVTPAKQRKLIQTAYYYMQQHHLHHASCRFDVIAITSPLDKAHVQWIQNAFSVPSYY